MARELAEVEVVEDGRTCRANRTIDPTWDQIAEAIRRLDRCRFPSLWINLSKSVEHDDMCVLRLTGFSVIGGAGAYWVQCSGGGHRQRQYLDPAGGDAEVDVGGPYLGQLGFSIASKHVCRDVDVVLRAAKYFCETGGFDPSTPWSA